MDSFRLACLVTFAISQISYMFIYIIEKNRGIPFVSNLQNSFKSVLTYIYKHMHMVKKFGVLIGPGRSTVEIQVFEESIPHSVESHRFILYLRSGRHQQ